MFQGFRNAVQALQAIVGCLRELTDSLQRAAALLEVKGDLEGRVGALERELHAKVAQAEAAVLKADATLKAARSAEERARYHASKQRTPESDEEDAEADAILEAYREAGIPIGDAQGGPEGEVPDVHGGVAPHVSGKAAALAKKWGRR